MLFYFKLDDEFAFNQDFYFDAYVQDYLLINATFIQDLNVTGICECYTQP